MRICHVAAHLPPDQGANALLPVHLGAWAREAGDIPTYVSYPPRALKAGAAPDASGPLPGHVAWMPARTKSALAKALGPLTTLAHARAVWRLARPSIAEADVVHVHSNGLLPDLGAWIAERERKPVVLTLYGTEIWHYEPKRLGPDMFTRAYRSAAHVTFYSQGLLDRAVEHGLSRGALTVIYPPVAEYFARADDARRAAARRAVGFTERNLLLNVKRLHPLAGQMTLIEALPAVLRAQPDTRLIFCGTGPVRADLEARARQLGLDSRVTFAGLLENRSVVAYYAAADLFVLPSRLEACPTVAVEALACGTPVVSSDSPGGLELGRLFGDDVRVVPKENPPALADAIVAALAHPRRTFAATDAVLDREFRPATVAARFAAVYREVTRTTRR